MCIHVSSATQELLNDECEWIEYSDRMIKGKGKMTTYIAKFGQWEVCICVYISNIVMVCVCLCLSVCEWIEYSDSID
jgi:hypothetical protein